MNNKIEMKKYINSIVFTFAVTCSIALLTACDNSGGDASPDSELEENVKDVLNQRDAEELKDAAEEAAQNMEDAAEDTMENAKDAADQAAQDLEEVANDVKESVNQ